MLMEPGGALILKQSRLGWHARLNACRQRSLHSVPGHMFWRSITANRKSITKASSSLLDFLSMFWMLGETQAPYLNPAAQPALAMCPYCPPPSGTAFVALSPFPLHPQCWSLFLAIFPFFPKQKTLIFLNI